MWYDTSVTRMLNIQYPMIQAPMAGGPTTPELVAAVSNEGALGFLGAGYLSPESIRSAIRRIRELTDRPFGVNLFVPNQDIQVDRDVVKAMIHHLKSLEALPEEVAREMDSIPIENVPGDTFADLAEAVHLQEAGVDAVVAQGYEAGGHRGTFLEAYNSSLIGTIALVPQIVDKIRIPVIASGGIMDGRGIAACLCLGASAIQMGTAFLASRESGAHPVYKNALLHSRDTETIITEAFSGKPARGLRNTFTSWMEHYDAPIPPYPIQNALTRPLRNWAARQADPEFMSLWAGQGSPQSRDASARDIVRQLIQEVERAMGWGAVEPNPWPRGTPTERSPLLPVDALRRQFQRRAFLPIMESNEERRRRDHSGAS